MYPVVNKVASQTNFSSSQELVYELFPKLGKFLAYTTDTPAVENVLKHVKNELGVFLDEQNPGKIDAFLDFFDELMKHLEVEAFLEDEKRKNKKDRKKLKWVEGYEFAEFMLNLYEKIPLLNLDQALKLMDMYYERVVKPVLDKHRQRLRKISMWCTIISSSTSTISQI